MTTRRFGESHFETRFCNAPQLRRQFRRRSQSHILLSTVVLAPRS